MARTPHRNRKPASRKALVLHGTKDADGAARVGNAAPARQTVWGYIDFIDPTGLVCGWCASVDAPHGPRSVAILLDGVSAIGDVACDLQRPDLQNAGIGDGRHGFEVMLPSAKLAHGVPCEVSLRDEATEEIVGRVAQVVWAAKGAALLEGQIESVSPEGIVTGWCWDRGSHVRDVTLEILLNGAACGTTRANLPREDLNRAGKGMGRHGFVFALDTTRLPLQPTHSVGLRDAGTAIQIGTPVSWQWPHARRMEDRLSAIERKVEVMARSPDTPGPASTAVRRGRRDSLELLWLSGEAHTPGHTYRVVRMVEAAKALGHQASFMPVGEASHMTADLRTIDALVIWRAPLTQSLRIVIDAARGAGAAILFDLDDLMVDPALARPEIIDAIRSEHLDAEQVKDLYRGIGAAVQLADATLVTTRELGLFVQALQKPAHVVPNGFDAATLRRARLAYRRRAAMPPDTVLRIGYAGGSRTHQRDFGLVAAPLARLLRRHPHCRLVLFRHARHGRNLLELGEYPALAGLSAQVEWRDMVEVDALPDELARFDINLAPLETGNVFCEAKSELKFFEAALAGVATVASPTGPFRRAIRDGETGLLAASAADWEAAIGRLIADASLRRRMAQAAYHDVLRLFGPERRQEQLGDVLAHLTPGRHAAQAFELGVRRSMAPPPALPHVPVHQVLYSADAGKEAGVSVVIPVYNYADVVVEALDSVWHQDAEALDLVVIDDRSTDQSLAVVRDWTARNGARFNRVVLIQTLVNSGLGLARNAGFAAAETPYVMLLDADNRLLPRCVSTCLAAIRESGAAYCYPMIHQFGDVQQVIGAERYWPARLGGGNFIDAMALIAKSAWAAVGGFDHVRFGWEDYDFWCRLAEHGLWGSPIGEILCEYRVHANSMLRRSTDIPANKLTLAADLERRHPWVSVARILAAQAAAQPPAPKSAKRRNKDLAPKLAEAATENRARPPKGRR